MDAFQITAHIHDSVNMLCKRILKTNETDGYVDTYAMYQEFTLDVIAKLAFGETRNLQVWRRVYLEMRSVFFISTGNAE